MRRAPEVPGDLPGPDPAPPAPEPTFTPQVAEPLPLGELVEVVRAWTVRLVDDRGNETAPERIEQVRRPGAVDITYFPYTTPWRRVYRVSFPAENDKGAPTISPEAKWFGLRFAGAQGHDTLTWTLAEKP